MTECQCHMYMKDNDKNIMFPDCQVHGKGGLIPARVRPKCGPMEPNEKEKVETDAIIAFGWLTTWCEKSGVGPLQFIEMWSRSFADKLATAEQKHQEELKKVRELIVGYGQASSGIGPLFDAGWNTGQKAILEAFDKAFKTIDDDK